MATASFSKRFEITKPESIKKFAEMASSEPLPKVKSEKAEKALARGRELLSQYYSR